MEYQATAKYIRTAPRKMRLVADAIRKLKPEEALTVLARYPKQAAKPLYTVLKAAIAASKEKNSDKPLVFSRIEIMEGPVMKRWRAVARGTAHGYKKRMSHIKIVLKEFDVSQKTKQKLGGKNGTKS